ncbi:MAG: hypothetical protein KIT31_23955 [Deltaproteobacteria bacterium]|nr:hypothetical protein [Deltaproteobacteria bacterium]
MSGARREERVTKRWLFSAPVDLAVFGGTAVIALALTLIAPANPSGEPAWTWITGVLLVDVAHVWSTIFIVYLDPFERRRRPALYAGVPLGCFALGVAVYGSYGGGTFWRIVAYLAVFHFIRQQYGWVMLYRARNGETDRRGRWIDGATVYAATLYPLLEWHARLPREFWWMRERDFIPGVPVEVAEVAGWIYAALLVAYVANAVATRSAAWGKHVVVATTAACWYVGIVANNSDYTFTVTNVFIHGIPYLALVYMYARNAAREEAGAGAAILGTRSHARGILAFLATLWAIAYVEELLWDRAVWHDREWLFGGGFDAGDWKLVVVPLLAMPQLAHYVLDAFLWRRRANPRLGRLL